MPDADLNGLLDDWSQGTNVILVTQGGVISGTLSTITNGIVQLYNATVGTTAVSVINVRQNEIIAAGIAAAIG